MLSIDQRVQTGFSYDVLTNAGIRLGEDCAGQHGRGHGH
jgi:hypothetical protein